MYENLLKKWKEQSYVSEQERLMVEEWKNLPYKTKQERLMLAEYYVINDQISPCRDLDELVKVLRAGHARLKTIRDGTHPVLNIK